jgi:hypothetical protein
MQTTILTLCTSPELIMYLCGRNHFRSKLCPFGTLNMVSKCCVLLCVRTLLHLPIRNTENSTNLIIIDMVQ